MKRRKYVKYTEDLKQQILAEVAEKGAVLAHVARKHNMNPKVIAYWRKKAAEAEVSTHAPYLSKKTTDADSDSISNSGFRPQSDKELSQTVLRMAQKEAESRGISPDRFVAEALRYALDHMS